MRFREGSEEVRGGFEEVPRRLRGGSEQVPSRFRAGSEEFPLLTEHHDSSLEAFRRIPKVLQSCKSFANSGL